MSPLPLPLTLSTLTHALPLPTPQTVLPPSSTYPTPHPQSKSSKEYLAFFYLLTSFSTAGALLLIWVVWVALSSWLAERATPFHSEETVDRMRGERDERMENGEVRVDGRWRIKGAEVELGVLDRVRVKLGKGVSEVGGGTGAGAGAGGMRVKFGKGVSGAGAGAGTGAGAAGVREV
ncbi:hypothetical protein L13192_07580 [Pyrenophora tritici-repentis]|nr:hypothetical protein L13192_07580 [Pyrenophora tritici-repentis]